MAVEEAELREAAGQEEDAIVIAADGEAVQAVAARALAGPFAVSCKACDGGTGSQQVVTRNSNAFGSKRRVEVAQTRTEPRIQQPGRESERL